MSSPLRDATTTWAPARARMREMAAPIPRLPPVMKATRPAMLSIGRSPPSPNIY
jgi:hypothetical protein